MTPKYQSLAVFGSNKEKCQKPSSTGSTNGCGFMDLFDLRAEKQKEWILPKINTQLFTKVLQDFANHFGVGKDKRIILPLDQAGWHMSKKLSVPEGIHLFPLPPYSPELQPAERLWVLINEPLVNEAFNSIVEVEEIVFQRCRRLLNQQELIRGLTFYHWFPEVKPA